jgi:hypothetical protein
VREKHAGDLEGVQHAHIKRLETEVEEDGQLESVRENHAKGVILTRSVKLLGRDG